MSMNILVYVLSLRTLSQGTDMNCFQLLQLVNMSCFDSLGLNNPTAINSQVTRSNSSTFHLASVNSHHRQLCTLDDAIINRLGQYLPNLSATTHQILQSMCIPSKTLCQSIFDLGLK